MSPEPGGPAGPPSSPPPSTPRPRPPGASPDARPAPPSGPQTGGRPGPRSRWRGCLIGAAIAVAVLALLAVVAGIAGTFWLMGSEEAPPTRLLVGPESEGAVTLRRTLSDPGVRALVEHFLVASQGSDMPGPLGKLQQAQIRSGQSGFEGFIPREVTVAFEPATRADEGATNEASADGAVEGAASGDDGAALDTLVAIRLRLWSRPVRWLIEWISTADDEGREHRGVPYLCEAGDCFSMRESLLLWASSRQALETGIDRLLDAPATAGEETSSPETPLGAVEARVPPERLETWDAYGALGGTSARAALLWLAGFDVAVSLASEAPAPTSREALRPPSEEEIDALAEEMEIDDRDYLAYFLAPEPPAPTGPLVVGLDIRTADRLTLELEGPFASPEAARAWLDQLETNAGLAEILEVEVQGTVSDAGYLRARWEVSGMEAWLEEVTRQ